MMAAMSIRALFLATLLLQTPEEPRGAISGRFTSAETSEPLKGVSVQILAKTHGHLITQSALSAADGTFSFPRLQPGTYFLQAQKSGYRPAEGFPGPLSLEKNQTRTGLEIKLHRNAAVTGRVSDPEGQPVVGAEVTAYRFVWWEGRRTAARSGSATSDDRGVYRIFQLPAGRYVIGASAPAEERPAGELDLNMTSTYYPAGTRPSEAAPLEVRWGQELPEINLAFRPQRSFQVSGRVIDAETGGPCRLCTVGATNLEEAYGFSQRQFGAAPDGGYRVRGLTAGTYRIAAEKAADGGRHIVSSRTVTIADSSLSDVHLVVGAGRTVTGKVVWDSPPADIGSVNMQIFFNPAEAPNPGAWARVAPDLSFEVTGLSAETYRVLLRGLPAGGYLKAVRLASSELPSLEVQVPEEGALSQLEVIVAFDSATLSGRVRTPETAGAGHRVTGAAIVLFPRENQSARLIERRTNTDSDGNFTLTGVAPGAYTAFALPQAGAPEIQDPEVRRGLQSYGKSVDLTPGKKEAVELTLTPESREPQ